MNGQQWRTLAGFGALTIVVSVFDRKAALWLVALVGIVAVLKHPDALGVLFGAADVASGG